MTHRSTRLIAAVAIVVLGLGYLFWNGMQHFTQYYLTVPEYSAQQATLAGQSAQVEGRIVGKSVVYNAVKNRLSFTMTGGGKAIDVVYYGSRPDVFTSDVHAIVSGTMQPSGVMAAKQVLVKCPSHYRPAPVHAEGTALGSSSP